MDLSGRTVVVVGGGSGIGRAIAEKSVGLGARVVLAGRGAERLERAAQELGGEVSAHAADVTREADVAALMESVGRFDHLVSSANRPAGGAVSELAHDDVIAALSTKLVAPLLLAKHGGSRVSADGSFTFFSGFLGWRPSPGGTVQALVNGGLAHLAQALAVELAPVRVNAISPGVVGSDVWDSMEPEARAGVFSGFEQRALTGRIGAVGDVADIALLAMTNASINATVLHADGGARLG